MHRLFVALRPPAVVRDALAAVMDGVRGARWQSDAQLHLTLRFVGEVDGRVAEDVATALDGVRHPPVAVTLAGLGRFERRGRTDALWIGVRAPASLAALHRKVDRALVTAGLAPEHRAYLPHVTLARLGAQAGDTAAFLARPEPVLPAFVADAFFLFESRLGQDGAHYEAVARYPLEG